MHLPIAEKKEKIEIPVDIGMQTKDEFEAKRKEEANLHKEYTKKSKK